MVREAESAGTAEDDASLAARAAWLHFVGRLTQSEVAARLNVPNSKAHRLIARASREGMVRVFIDGRIGRCADLEARLCRLFHLDFCEVAPNTDDDDLPLRSLGVLGARYIRLACEKGTDRLIGLGHGRTLAACVQNLPRLEHTEVRFVSLLGGFTRRFAANPFDVLNRIAERTGAEAYVLPVPFCMNSAEDRAVLMAQRGIDEVAALGRASTLRIVGIGAVDSIHASLASTGMVDAADFDAVAAEGGMGEILGQFFDRRGQRVGADLSNRLASPSFEDVRSGKLVAVAGGTSKPEAIRAVLRSGLLHGLLTDEKTAGALVAPPPTGSA